MRGIILTILVIIFVASGIVLTNNSIWKPLRDQKKVYQERADYWDREFKRYNDSVTVTIDTAKTFDQLRKSCLWMDSILIATDSSGINHIKAD